MKKEEDGQAYTLEELERLEGLNHAVHVAVCSTREWKPGKQVTKAEYKAAVKEFMTAPVGRSKRC